MNNRHKRDISRPAIGVAIACLLTACGGGGGGETTTSPPPPPPAQTYSIGGSASGLAGSSLSLQNNSVDDLEVSQSGSFSFATEVDSGSSYNVTVAMQPRPANSSARRVASISLASSVTLTVMVARTCSASIGPARYSSRYRMSRSLTDRDR